MGIKLRGGDRISVIDNDIYILAGMRQERKVVGRERERGEIDM